MHNEFLCWFLFILTSVAKKAENQTPHCEIQEIER